MKLIYLDYNATTPIDPAVVEAMQPFLDQHFGNPSSSHVYGIHTKKAVETARKQIADMLGCQMDEVIFTSGGSESNNYAIKGAAWQLKGRGNHIITSSIEHPAVTEVCRFLEQQGFKVTYLPVDEDGLIDPAQVEDAITPQTILISIMHANNEVGTIQPVAEISEIAQRHQILMHTDAAQSVGKIPVNVEELGIDLLSIAGHKLYALKGIGALYIRTGVKLQKLIHGADHEMHQRAGTENVLEIVGLGKACELIAQNLTDYQQHLQIMRDRLESKIKHKFHETRINGHLEHRLPNTASMSFRGLEANTILSELDEVAVSAGAACHSDQVDVSHVLEAMKVPVEFAMGTIRFSTGRFTTTDEIERAAEKVGDVVTRLQPQGAPVFLQTDTREIRLTQFTHGLGCACKLRPQMLEEVIRKLPVPSDAKILVGTETADDAAVYKLNEQLAVVQTVDFFTPIVDDPYQFGAIAAANSLSDIYAMGAKPLFALNIVGFPSNRLPVEVLEEILKGAQEKSLEAGISIIGGHTVDDTEPKFGLAVTGIVHPEEIVKNFTAKPGDKLVLTKPLGTGVLSTALKQGLLEKELADLLSLIMSSLNKTAAEIMQEVGVNACTDITGFGLLGHLLEMMNGARTSAIIHQKDAPVLPEVFELVTSGVVPGGTRDNFSYTNPYVEYDARISENRRLILNDAQTSGGLLMSLPEERANALLEKLHSAGIEKAAIIGEVIQAGNTKIQVI